MKLCWHKWAEWITHKQKLTYHFGNVEFVRKDGKIDYQTSKSTVCKKCGKVKTRNKP